MTTERQVTRDELLDRARAAYDSMAWSTAVELLMAADREAPLDLDGLELLGVSAHLVGRDDVAVQAGMRGFALGAESGDFERAARAGFWTGMGFAFRGEIAQAGAWFGRAAELIEKSGRESVESGYLLIPVGLGQLEGQHDPDGGVPDVPADLRDRRALRRRRPGDVRAAGARRVADRIGRARPRHPPPRRGDGRRDGRRGVAVGGRDGVLRDHRGLPRDLRHAAGAGMDDRAHRLVCRPARPRVPRPVPHLPRRAHALPRRLGDRRRRGAARPARARGTAGQSGHRRGSLRGGRAAPGPGQVRRCRTRIRRGQRGSAVDPSRASPSSDLPRVGPPPPAA